MDVAQAWVLLCNIPDDLNVHPRLRTTDFSSNKEHSLPKYSRYSHEERVGLILVIGKGFGILDKSLYHRFT